MYLVGVYFSSCTHLFPYRNMGVESVFGNRSVGPEWHNELDCDGGPQIGGHENEGKMHFPFAATMVSRHHSPLVFN